MLTRREFLHRSLLLASAGALAACSPREAPTLAKPADTPVASPVPSPTRPLATTTVAPTVAPAPSPTMTASPVPPTATQAYLAVARGSRPAAITQAAIDALGGIGRFVKKGDDVIIKPNMCNAWLKPEYASTTNPEVVATLVRMCVGAGAKRVRVMDEPFGGSASEAYKNSGIRAAVEAAGGQMEIMADAKYVKTNFPNGKSIKTWSVYQDILKADVVINVPIAKVHDAAKLTLAMKCLMGVVLDRNSIHIALDQRIADLSTVIKPTLNVIDGVRVLTKNGPTSWNLADVVNANTVIASHDIVAADAYAATTFFKKTPQDIGYIRIGGEMGLGRIDIENLRIKEVTL